MGIFDGATGAGLGAALSRGAERIDLENRARREMAREKDMYKYKLEQDELNRRAALQAGGSDYMRNEMNIDAAGRMAQKESDIAFEARQKGWVIGFDENGNIDPKKSGPEVNEQLWKSYQEENAASLNRPHPKTGISQEKKPMMPGTKTAAPAATKTTTKPKPGTKPGTKPETPEQRRARIEQDKIDQDQADMLGWSVDRYRAAKSGGETSPNLNLQQSAGIVESGGQPNPAQPVDTADRTKVYQPENITKPYGK